jgi:hypothetical protein
MKFSNDIDKPVKDINEYILLNKVSLLIREALDRFHSNAYVLDNTCVQNISGEIWME